MDMNNICRLCLLYKDSMMCIFPQHDQHSSKISDRIFECVSIKISKTDLGPHSVCMDCMEYMNVWYEFKQRCDTSNNILNEYIKELVMEMPDIASTSSQVCGETKESTISDLSSVLNTFQVTRKEHYSLDTLDKLVKEIKQNTMITGNIEAPEDTLFGGEKDTILVDRIIQDYQVSNELELDNMIEDTQDSTFSLDEMVNEQVTEMLMNNIDEKYRNQKMKTKTKEYECEICNTRYGRFTDLTKHDLNHETNWAFRCEKCCQIFISDNRLKMHLNFCKREKTIQCDICMKYYSTEKSLNNHKKIHLNPLECKKCNYKSTTNFHLQQHINAKHNDCDKDEKMMYKCDLCHKSYKFQLTLNRHIKLIHEKQKERYKCDKCEYETLYSCNMNKHLDTHSIDRYVCEKCGSNFKTKSCLTQHMITHTHVKRYSCNVCEKSFYTNYLLNSHLQTHTNDRDYECAYCMKLFTSKKVIARHINTIHLRKKKEGRKLCVVCRNSSCRGVDRHLSMYPKSKLLQSLLATEVNNSKTT